MGTTTFTGPVRSEGGFYDVIKNTSTGAFTEVRAITSAQMTGGTGITTGTGTVYEGTVTKTVTPNVTYFYTQIFVDLTGLNSGDTTLDIIGVAPGVANCHIGQITTAANGIVYAGAMTCLETPAGGDTDIDLYSATEGTGVEDTLITALTETALLDAGASSLGTTDLLTAWPAADEYLYLAGVDGGNATYTAGRLLIELWGSSV
jgi:hypothetical protein